MYALSLWPYRCCPSKSIFLPVKREASSRCHHSNTLFGWCGDSLSSAEVKTNIFLVPQWVFILCPHQTHCRMFIFKNRLQKWNTLLFSLYHFSITAAWNWIVNIKCMLASTSRGHTSAARTSLTSKCGFLGAHGTQCPSDLRRRIWLGRPFALLIVYVFNSDTTPVLC